MIRTRYGALPTTTTTTTRTTTTASTCAVLSSAEVEEACLTEYLYQVWV
nr:hypothetical protein [Brenneria izadpanahii]